jgi:GGDEF domain-containing protein
MSLRQFPGFGATSEADSAPIEPANSERILTFVVEGTARGVPKVDHEAYEAFRATVAKLAMQLPDRLPEEEKLTQIRALLHEYENYRTRSETELRNRTTEWRAMAALLFRTLMNSLSINPTSPDPAKLLQHISTAAAAQEIQTCSEQIDAFLHPSGADSAPSGASQYGNADHSTANDNAAGLRGGGAAIEHVRRIMESGHKGFIVLFRLSCLDMINQRFGQETVQDSLMAVSAFLTHNLKSDDAIYHWTDSSLLAILEGRANEQILTAELDRVVMRNRETTVTIGGRPTMLRIPITFDVTPIERLRTAEDLCKITLIVNSRRSR